MTEEPAWLATARTFIGTSEIKGRKHNPTIVEFLTQSGMKAKGRDTDEAAWCAAFVLHCLRSTREKVDYPAKPHRARSWETYGTPLAERKVGAVVVVSPTPGTRRRHVGFYLADEGDRVVLLGGNQDDQVNEKSYPGTNAVFRWPPD